MAAKIVGRSSGISRDEVYIAAVPLRAAKGPAQLLLSTAYSLNIPDLQHFLVIIKPPSPHQPVVYDFQPEDPENVLVALAALSGRKVSGVVNVRSVGRVPKRKCWFVGYVKEKNGRDAALEFNRNWETDLRIGHHDCRNYAQGLVECLTGKAVVLEHLRRENTYMESPRPGGQRRRELEQGFDRKRLLRSLENIRNTVLVPHFSM